LSLVQVIARQTLASGTDDFTERFGLRVRSLAAEQDLLIHNDWGPVPVSALVESQLSHFSDLIGSRIEFSGPPLSLTPDAMRALGMALHELATNAAKYGALSNSEGKIAVHWSVEPDAAPPSRFNLTWLERNG